MPGLYLWILGGNRIDNLTNTTGSSNCSDGVRWLYVLLGDCVVNDLGYASDIFGILSILLWVMVATP